MNPKFTKKGNRLVGLALFSLIVVIGLTLSPGGALVSPESFKAYAQDSGEVVVVEMVLCKDVVDREPYEPTAEVSLSEGKIYTWTKIKASNPPTFVKHVYYLQGKNVAEVTLNITYPTFRTWSSKTIKGNWMLGQWRVEVISADETLLASKEFTVVE